MTKKTSYILGILITIIAGTYFYISCCSTCVTEKEVILIEKINIDSEATLEVTSNKFFFQHCNYSFNWSSSSILIPPTQKMMVRLQTKPLI